MTPRGLVLISLFVLIQGCGGSIALTPEGGTLFTSEETGTSTPIAGAVHVS